MRFLAIAFLLVVQCCGTTQADEIKPVPDPINDQIHLPTTPVTVQPDDIAPAPSPLDQTLIQDLHEGELYVIDHPMKLRVLDSREGFVKITVKEGPLSLYARFVDGVDRLRYEDRTYAGPFVYVVQAVKSGEVELLIISGEDSPVVRNVLTVTVGPRPPPIPDPIDPIVDPIDPITPSKLQVLIIEDPETTTAQQAAIFDSSAFRKYIATHCSMTGNQRDYLKISKNQSVSDQAQWVQDAFAISRPGLPFLVIMTPTKKTSGVLPGTLDETLKTLKMLGGE